MPHRVLIADDHSLFRDGVASLIRAAGLEVVGEASNGELAVSEARRLRPDLVLLDIHMPKQTGLEALRQIRAELPGIQVVMLTVSDSDSDLFEAIRAGADGYLLKNLDARAFTASLEALDRGEIAMSRQMASRVIDGMARRPQLAAQPLPPNLLTEREVDLLRLIVDGLSNRAIGERWGVSENTVKYHVRNVLQKLNLSNRTEIATYALQHVLTSPTAPPDQP